MNRNGKPVEDLLLQIRECVLTFDGDVLKDKVRMAMPRTRAAP
ncbi:MAG: hypothetical protein Q8O43_07790 [Dehalococcoidia bacterium]|nr:hypothetical protein [Dehalococcoidia bacterium]